jgi:hypothetical protein
MHRPFREQLEDGEGERGDLERVLMLALESGYFWHIPNGIYQTGYTGSSKPARET